MDKRFFEKKTEKVINYEKFLSNETQLRYPRRIHGSILLSFNPQNLLDRERKAKSRYPLSFLSFLSSAVSKIIDSTGRSKDLWITYRKEIPGFLIMHDGGCCMPIHDNASSSILLIGF